MEHSPNGTAVLAFDRMADGAEVGQLHPARLHRARTGDAVALARLLHRMSHCLFGQKKREGIEAVLTQPAWLPDWSDRAVVFSTKNSSSKKKTRTRNEPVDRRNCCAGWPRLARPGPIRASPALGWRTVRPF